MLETVNKERLLKSGKGWRIGWNPTASEWAMELTEAELNDFCRLLGQLVQTMSQIAGELMDEERISCEAESEFLWMEVKGFPHSYELRLILNRGRRCEGYWSESAAGELAQATQILKIF